MRDQKAQMSVDFLIGMLILIGAFAFSVQFVTGSILPITTNTQQGAPIVVNEVSEKLVSDQRWFATGRDGEVNLSTDNTDKLDDIIDNGEELKKQLGLPLDYRLNITMEGDTIDKKMGEAPAGSTGSVSSIKRMAYDTNSNEQVTIKVRVW